MPDSDKAFKKPSRDSWGVFDPFGPARSDLAKVSKEIKQQTDAVFEVILLGFELVNTVLDLIASFLLDITNPLKPVIELILSILESLINDIKKAGFYYTYDKGFTEDIAQYFGGYPAYEDRIIKKLLNKDDYTRPDFSADTSLFAINFFAGVGLEGIEGIYKNIIKPISQLLALLKKGGDEDKASSPKNLETSLYKGGLLKYEVDFKSSFTEDSLPDGVKVKWQLKGQPSDNPFFPRPYLAPKEFLIAISTRNKNEKIGYLKTRTLDSNEGEKGQDSKTEVKLIENPRQIPANLLPLVLSKSQPLADDAEVVGLEVKNSNLKTEDYRYAVLAEEDVYLNKAEGVSLKDAYRVYSLEVPDNEIFGFLNDPDFEAYLPLEEMKIGNKLADDYYVSVYSYNKPEDQTLFYETVRDSNLKKVTGVEEDLIDPYQLSGVEVLGLSEPTEIKHIDIPTIQKSDFLRALREFYTIYYLCNLESVEAQKYYFNQEMIYGETAKFLSSIKAKVYDDSLSTFGDREITLEFFESFIERSLLNTTLPAADFISANQDLINEINQLPFSFFEVLVQSQDSRGNQDGYFKSSTPEYEGIFTEFGETMFEGYTSFEDLEKIWDNIEIYAEYEIIVDTYPQGFISILEGSNKVQSYIGSLPQARKIVENGAILLYGVPVVAGSFGGQWYKYRPFENTDLSALISGFEDFKSFLDRFFNATQGIIDEILKYIKLIQIRIEELRLIILKIKALIDAILNFSLPTGIFATYHITNGTNALVSAISRSENKPPIGNDGVGVGAMLVAGGLPNIVVDLLKLMIGGDD
jgi:hypothetical protein